MKVHYALAAMAASASALIAPAAMPRALVARPAPTADATVLEVPRPRPLFEQFFETWLLRLNSPNNYSVAPESKLESDLYPWPSWSLVRRRAKKALDLSPNLSGGVGSNPTGCTHERRRRDTGRTGKSEGRGFDSRIGLSADWTCAR